MGKMFVYVVLKATCWWMSDDDSSLLCLPAPEKKEDRSAVSYLNVPFLQNGYRNILYIFVCFFLRVCCLFCIYRSKKLKTEISTFFSVRYTMSIFVHTLRVSVHNDYIWNYAVMKIKIHFSISQYFWVSLVMWTFIRYVS